MQKAKRDSVDFTAEEDPNIELESSFVSAAPELDSPQMTSQIVFMLLQVFHTILTVSLGPLYPQIAQFYKISEGRVHFLYGISVISCILAFIPTNQIIGKQGVKSGLFVCLIGATIGGLLCCMVNVNFGIFQLGYFLMQFWMQGIHAGKGFFTNLYFPEKNVFPFVN
jgi:MFS family permease